jgi:predicted RNA-binding Zn-ribbon protein involved in translation (DUF1610 family)
MPIGPDELDRLVGDDPLLSTAAAELPPTCLGCGYNLTALTVARCPECGQVFRRRDIKRQMSEMKVRVLALKNVNEWTRFGFWSSVIGISLWGIGFAIRSTSAGAILTPLTRIVSFLFGVVGIALGLSFLRVYRLPAWVRLMHGIEPRLSSAFGAVALGALLLLLPIIVP